MSEIHPPAIWAPSAELDLVAALERVESDVPGFAKTIEGHIRTAARLAARMPSQGEVVPEFRDPKLRQLSVVGHRIIYEPTADTVRILAVLRQPTTLTDDPRLGLRIVAPGSAELFESESIEWLYPFTVEQLRDGTRDGSLFRWEIEAGEKRSGLLTRFTDVQDAGCTSTTDILDKGGRVTNSRGGWQSWRLMRKHTRYPVKSSIESTTRREETITTPAGTFDCLLFIVSRGPNLSEKRVWFAKEIAGPPVLMEQWRDGERLTRMMLVQHREDHVGGGSLRGSLHLLSDERACIQTQDDGGERLYLSDCTGEGPELASFFRAFKASPDAHRITQVDFYSEAEHPITGTPHDQRAIEALAQDGPFPGLRKLGIDGEEHVVHAPVTDLSALTTAVPDLERLSVTWPEGTACPGQRDGTAEGLQIGHEFRLDRLEHLILGDLDAASLVLLSRCTFPRLATMELGLCHGPQETREEHERALRAFFTTDRFPGLRVLFLSCPQPLEHQKSWFTAASLNVMAGSPVLRGLVRFELDLAYQGNSYTDEQFQELRSMASQFAHIDTFTVDGDPVTPVS